jgi:hypothetical protein
MEDKENEDEKAVKRCELFPWPSFSDNDLFTNDVISSCELRGGRQFSAVSNKQIFFSFLLLVPAVSSSWLSELNVGSEPSSCSLVAGVKILASPWSGSSTYDSLLCVDASPMFSVVLSYSESSTSGSAVLR